MEQIMSGLAYRRGLARPRLDVESRQAEYGDNYGRTIGAGIRGSARVE